MDNGFRYKNYFETVNHDKLSSILRENMNNSTTLHLIRFPKNKIN